MDRCIYCGEPSPALKASTERYFPQSSAEWEKEFDSEFIYSAYNSGSDEYFDWQQASKDIKSFIHKLIEQAREEGYLLCEKDTKGDHKIKYGLGFEAGRAAAFKEVVEMIEGMKTTERKVHTFGCEEAETYSEKMLVNAVLFQLKQSITSKLTQKV